MGTLLRDIVLASGQCKLLFPVCQGGFVQNIDHITAKTRNALVQPKTQNIFYLFQHFWVMIIQVGLLFRKQMQIILAAFLVKLPAVLGKKTGPVVRRFPILPWSPDIIVPVWAVFISAFLKPRVFIGGMVDYQVQNDFDIPFPGFINQLFHICHGAKIKMNIAVIADIVAIVGIRRWINRAEPQDANAKILQVVQVLEDARQITNTVPVCILKAAGINLIDHPILPPLFHRSSPFMRLYRKQ